MALKVGVSSSFRNRIFTRRLQEGYRHIDGAWVYRTLQRTQLLRFLNGIRTQARRSNWPNRSAILGSREKSCSSVRSSRKLLPCLVGIACEPVLVFRFHHCDRVEEFFEDSLKALGLDYIDLVSIPSSHACLLLISAQYLIHTPAAWADTSMITRLFGSLDNLAHHCDIDPVGEEFPLPDGKIQLYDTTVNKTWSKMEDLLKTGKVRAIGVSNFSIKTLVTFCHLVRMEY